MVEFRFYLFTLIAVFLALATGMFIGSALPGSEALAEKQDAIKAQIEREFAALRQRERFYTQQVADLEEKVRAGDLFAASVLPPLVQGRLAGRRVAVLTTRAAPYPAQVADVLRQAGAVVSQITVAVPGVVGARGGDSERERWREAGRLLARSLITGARAGEGASAGPGVGGTDSGGATAGAQAGGSEVGTRPGDSSGAEPLAGVVVLVHPGDRVSDVQALAGGLAEVLGPAGVRLVGGESRDTRPSIVPAFMRLGFSTVDDADLPSGQVALVLLLAGAGDQGHYGIKETARGILPQPVPAVQGGRP